MLLLVLGCFGRKDTKIQHTITFEAGNTCERKYRKCNTGLTLDGEVGTEASRMAVS